MATIGDTIDLLSTATPLTAGTSWISSAVVLGQYNGLNVMVKTDQLSSLKVEWSGDNGINFDFSDDYIINPLDDRILAISVKQKTCRFTIRNDSGSNQTFLRMFTYGVLPSNSVVVSDISDINVNVTSDTSYGDLVVNEPYSLHEYNFYSGTSTPVTALSNTLITSYPDIFTLASASADNTCAVDNVNHCLYLTTGSANGHGASIQGSSNNVPVASTFQGRLCVSFTYGNTSNTSLQVGFGYSGSNSSPQAFSSSTDGVYIGWKDAGVHTYDNFSFIVGSTVIPRTSFNQDKMDGSGFPVIDLTQPNIFVIIMTCVGLYSLYALNPYKRDLVLLHVESRLNNATRPMKPPTGLVIHAFNNANPVTECRCNVFGVKMLADIVKENFSIQPVNLFANYLGGGDRLVAVFRTHATFAGSAQNYYSTMITSLNVVTDGISPIFLKFYLDGTVVGGAWSQPHPYLPIEINTTATYTPSTRLVESIVLGSTDSKKIEYSRMTPFVNGYRYTAVVCSSSNDFNLATIFNLSAP
jgi:hypothetical protein